MVRARASSLGIPLSSDAAYEIPVPPPYWSQIPDFCQIGDIFLFM